MKKLYIYLLLTLAVVACGDPAVKFDDVEYEPKIVVEGFIYPGKEITDIKLKRNFPLEEKLDTTIMYLTPEKNNVSIKINNIELQYDENRKSYSAKGVIADFNKAYSLTVSASIDGINLYTEAETVTPAKGFEVLEENLGQIKHWIQKPTFHFTPSPGSDFYAMSIRPRNATLDNFIYDNPYEPNVKRDDLEDRFERYLYQVAILINVDSYVTKPMEYEINGLDTWFYDKYDMIMYAGDRNFKDYVLTVEQVQQMDGNFIEPKFHLEGDGIGVFASAVVDTVSFEIIK